MRADHLLSHSQINQTHPCPCTEARRDRAHGKKLRGTWARSLLETSSNSELRPTLYLGTSLSLQRSQEWLFLQKVARTGKHEGPSRIKILARAMTHKQHVSESRAGPWA